MVTLLCHSRFHGNPGFFDTLRDYGFPIDTFGKDKERRCLATLRMTGKGGNGNSLMSFP